MNIPKFKIKSIVINARIQIEDLNRNSLQLVSNFKPTETGFIESSIANAKFATDITYFGFFILKNYDPKKKSLKKLVKISLPKINQIWTPNNLFEYEEEFENLFQGSEPLTIKGHTSCQTKDPIDAKKIHLKLKGLAVPISCNSTFNKVIEQKREGYFLLDAGWYFESYLEFPHTKLNFSIKEIEFF